MPLLDVSIIIPFKDKAEMTLDCLHSLQTFGGDIKEILLISNNSSASELAAVKAGAKQYKNVTLLEYNQPFNYQKINNWAAAKSNARAIMMLNNDVELVPQSARLIEAMYERALRPDVGAVGCVLLYEDRKTIQHAGVYLIAGGTADNLYVGKSFKQILKKSKLPAAQMANINHDLQLSAVTAAALIVERSKFNSIQGLNEDFIICGGDVDLCLRLEDAGYKSLLTGANHGFMLHKESKSRSMLAIPYVDFVESYKSYVKHFDFKQGDPYLTQQEVINAK